MRPARFLTLMVPAGVEKFFEEVGKPASDPSSPPPFEEEDIDRVLAVAPRYGVEILSPKPSSVFEKTSSKHSGE